jgi:DNA invertase Pin-like site-specific DNA recombinase
MKFGYARISRQDQSLDLQKDALIKFGIEPENIFTDKISGAKSERPGLNLMLLKLRAGDEVIVWRLDRLGRSTKDLVGLINDFSSRGILFRSLTENLETQTANGKLIFNIFASLAEFEKNLIRERTVAGLSAARARGKFGGRPKADKSKIDVAVELYNSKKVEINKICEIVGISKGTLYKYINAKDSKGIAKI